MKIRNVDLQDSSDILNWRNDVLSISMSNTNTSIMENQHINWLKDALNNPLKMMYIGELNNLKVGICRFDFEPESNSSIVSINLNPIFRGQGLSFHLLNNAIERYKDSNSSLLKAIIKKNNFSSIKIFEKCKFTRVSISEECLYYELA